MAAAAALWPPAAPGGFVSASGSRAPHAGLAGGAIASAGASAALALTAEEEIEEAMANIPEEFLNGDAVLTETGEKMYMVAPALEPEPAPTEAVSTFSSQIGQALASFDIGKVFALIGDGWADAVEGAGQTLEDGGVPWELVGGVFFGVVLLANFVAFIVTILGSDPPPRQAAPARPAARASPPPAASSPPVRRAGTTPQVKAPADPRAPYLESAEAAFEKSKDSAPAAAAQVPTPTPPPTPASEKPQWTPPKKSA